MASEYLKWKYRDVAPEEKRELTPAEKRANWWHYHWRPLLLAAAVLAVLGGIVWEQASRVEPDCCVALVTRYVLPDGDLEALRTALEAVCPDVNGDGRVRVGLNAIQLDFTAGEQGGAAAMALASNQDKLNADFYTRQSGIFLLDDPAGFQARHAALSYLDGTVPGQGAPDWENMAVPWEDCPAVAGLTLTGPDGGRLWFARRVVQGEEDQRAFSGAGDLWERLFPPAGAA